MEAQQRQGVEFQLPQVRPVAVAQVAGQGQGRLLRVVGGEDGGAVKAPRAGIAAPLEAHGEEDGVQRDDGGEVRRQERHGDGGCGGDERGHQVRVRAEPVG